jgi:hypothetical protein
VLVSSWLFPTLSEVNIEIAELLQRLANVLRKLCR